MTDLGHRSFPELDHEYHKSLETATFCLGCFWGPDSEYGAMEGIVRTRVGYSGGILDNPTYHNIGDHIETLQVDFDPEIIQFDDIAGIFWSSHNPAEPYWNRQYAKAIFYHDAQQKEIIERQRDKITESLGKSVNTEIIKFERFCIAENYHQKYHLQNVSSLLRDYKKIFSRFEGFINSTSVARVNGYVRGYGRAEDFDKNVDRLGLSEQSKIELKKIFYKYKKKVV